jgi:hypothetical protein
MATLESWSRYLDDHPAPQMPVQYDMLSATGPWAWWAVGAWLFDLSWSFISLSTPASGTDPPSRSRQASDQVPDDSGNTTNDIALVPSAARPAEDSEESDNEQPDSRGTSQAVAKAPRKGKAKAGDSKRMTPWGPPEMGGVDFDLDLQDAIDNLEPGQLLSPSQVYSSLEWHGLSPGHPLRAVSVHMFEPRN